MLISSLYPIFITVLKPLTISILRLLSDGLFHSGEEMSKVLDVSRASISNALKDIENIYKVRGRGYCLSQPMQWLDIAKINSVLCDKANFFHIDVIDVVDSTNSILLKNTSLGATHGSCVVAELQTNGRGRRGRIWHTDLGGALTFSVLWRFAQGASFLSGLSLAVGVAVVRALRELGIDNVAVKWPNDILHEYLKLAGILIELQGDVLGPSSVVIGVGLNVNLSDNIKNCIDQPLTDLHQLSKINFNRNVLLGKLLIHISDVLHTFERSGFVAIRDEWVLMHAYHNKNVRLLMPNNVWLDGMVTGVDEDGSLLVNTVNGLQSFTSGEISLRGTL